MKATQQFIKDAIGGGWRDPIGDVHIYVINDLPMHLERIFLDPLAWQAVGKTRGWLHDTIPFEKLLMRKFVDYLCDGLSIEEALTKLS